MRFILYIIAHLDLFVNDLKWEIRYFLIDYFYAVWYNIFTSIIKKVICYAIHKRLR